MYSKLKYNDIIHPPKKIPLDTFSQKALNISILKNRVLLCIIDLMNTLDNRNKKLDPEGECGINKRGHRGYVGGLWEEIGSLQFDFLVKNGLKPQHALLDIACGCLRLGVKVIPYLDQSRYMGIEKEELLIQAGLEKELPTSTKIEKKPTIIHSSSFDFQRFQRKSDYAIAQSLFTHLPPDMINLCFRKLHPIMKQNGVFFATYHEVTETIDNPNEPHDHGYFGYTRGEIVAFGCNNGFLSNYIGEWGHPRSQVIAEYRIDNIQNRILHKYSRRNAHRNFIL